jgi:hypothetical protein
MEELLVTQIEDDPEERARRIRFEQAEGGHVYRRPDGSHVIVRPRGARWPPYTRPEPVTDKAGWVEITH